MFQNEPTTSPANNHLAIFGLTTRHEKALQQKPQVACNDSLFTNEAILTLMTKGEKNLKMKRISFKRPSNNQNHELSQLLKISSLATNLEKNQKQEEKQNISAPIKIQNDQEIKYIAKRPKSAVCHTLGFTDLKICSNQQKQQIQPEIKPKQIVRNPVSDQSKKIIKELILKEKFLGKINLFTSNSNVFIPRNNKQYGSYLNKLKNRQGSPRDNHQKVKRNTASNINQRQLQEKCRQILNLDSKISNSAILKGIKRKKIGFPKTNQQLFKQINNTECNQSILRYQQGDRNQEAENKNQRKSLSQHLEPQYCQILKEMYKIAQIHKKKDSKLKEQKYFNPKYKQKQKKSKYMILKKNQTRKAQPSLYIERVQVGLEALRKKKQYYRVTSPDRMQSNELNLLIIRANNSTNIHKKDLQQQLQTVIPSVKASRELSINI